ncbi:MAG: rhodanese-like domain-containing protein [Desulfobulbaceae bacterium]|nr:rhodanese-like domain-containing protein [Desulfobulbaceae bacterium]HIJ89639.1 sulfurtransferase [Deltaproteobacteria bacterium]
MNWKNLFVPGEDFSVSQAREYMAARGADAYQLLDVRQPKEYEDGHLPGAILIPLRELPGRLGELDKEKPVIVYCAVGGRSKAAAQLLAGKDFASVYNMTGGIKAWEGPQAKGPEEVGLEFFTGQEEYEDGVSLAYAMENGLQEFYRAMAGRVEGEEERQLYLRLVGFEDKHKARLLAEFRQAQGIEVMPGKGESGSSGPMEGGGKVEDFIARVDAHLQTKQDILVLAMALETQAVDLYSRLGQKSKKKETKALFLRLADEEKLHLSYLADEMDKLLSQSL